jgi:thiamine biosynthesis lipoprotein ApbE
MKMQEITRRKIELETRVTTPGHQTTERDVAEAQELVNQYIDELERLEQTAKPVKSSNIQTVIDFAMSKWWKS